MSTAVEVRYQEAVIALAEELNYTRAANRLRITQSALTKQIRELEKILRFPLFKRDKKSVMLTPAGEEFVREARLAVLHAERAVNLARTAQDGTGRVVTVGRSPYASQDLIAGLFAIELPLYPSLRVHLESEFSLDLVHSVAAGSVDFAIVTEVPVPQSLTSSALIEAPLHAVLNEDDPTAKEESVSIRDLADKSWAVFSKKAHPLMYDRLFGIVKREGINVKEVQHVLTAQEALPLVADQDYVSFVTESTASRTQRVGVVFRPIRDEEMLLHTTLIMRADNESRLVNSFVRTYLKTLQRKAS
jgi:LysR family transcriptional regulator, benzoate and cis,cis-muconate-responsive activator of ben and cat genes